VDMQTIAA